MLGIRHSSPFLWWAIARRHLDTWVVAGNTAGALASKVDAAECAVHNGVGNELDWLDERGFRGDFATYAALLRRCGNTKALLEGKRVHAHIVSSGQGGTFLGNLLVQMYGKCGSLEDAIAAFAAIRERNVFSWTIMIAAYAQNGHYMESLGLLRNMDLEGVKPTDVTLVNILSACSSLEELSEGKRIHDRIVSRGLQADGILGTALVNMYGKCGCLENARSVFDGMQCKDVVAWNAMIAAYAQRGHGMEALELYYQMEPAGVRPDRCTFLSTLAACSSAGALEDGREIHHDFVASGFKLETSIGNTLVNMYGKCGRLEEARMVFEQIPCRNAVTWSVMIAAYAQHEKSTQALRLHRLMEQDGVKPSENTFLSAISACSSVGFLSDGKELHRRIVMTELYSDVMANSLLSMYSKCGSLDDARKVFDGMPSRSVVSWTSLIAAYAQHGHPQQALELYKKMDSEGMKPDEVAYFSVLDAISCMGAVDEGKAIHAQILATGYESDVVGTALVSMYGKCGSLEDARRVFDGMLCKDVISWTAMIAAYAQQGHGKEALMLFRRLDLEGIKPNQITFVSALDACSGAEDITDGSRIHARVVANGFEGDVILGTALVNLYDRCGSLVKARRAFEAINSKNVISWNSIVAAYAHQGYREEASSLLRRMDQDGLKPNVISFTCILFACSHAGLVNEARYQFLSMMGDYGIDPIEDNYGCMIDLFGRAGHLDKVEDLLNNMPLQPSPVLWMILLGACKIHGDVERGARAAGRVFQLDPTNASPYVLLSNIYAEVGRWDDAAELKRIAEQKAAGMRVGLQFKNLQQQGITSFLCSHGDDSV